ncbi:MAG: hypothetical protein V4739_09815 [Pseudomonadota bacterium]
MSNHHWVCFTCREAVRRPGGSPDVRCPTCAVPCQSIGCKTPVPPKSKRQLWQALEADRAQAQREGNASARLASVQQVHALEKELARIESLPDNPGRRALIKQLHKQLKAKQSTLQPIHQSIGPLKT